MKPSWAIRRRYIFAGFGLGVIMLIASIISVWQDKVGAGDLVTGGVALVTLILTSYVFGAVWEDKSFHGKEENPDG
jgi:hypothetical protein